MKMHLRANKVKEGVLNIPRCASRPKSNGKIIRNNRETYQNIPQSNIVGFKEFAVIPANDRCAHCIDMGLIARNRLRKANGLNPVVNLFDDLK
jgi:hypothetical protein